MIIKLFYVDLPPEQHYFNACIKVSAILLDSISNSPVFYSDGQVSSLVESSEL